MATNIALGRDPWAKHEDNAQRAVVVRDAADACDCNSLALRAKIDRAYDFLTSEYLPNARAEQLLRDRLAIRDCRQRVADQVTTRVDALASRLADAKARLAHDDPSALVEVRSILHEIAALLELHFAA